jgi:hypothetical protein
VDFTLAMAAVHEMPSASRFFVEAAAAMKPGATLLLAEPAGHVKDKLFAVELQAAAEAGFTMAERPAIRRSRVVLLRKASS